MDRREQPDRRRKDQPHVPERRQAPRRYVGEKLECPACGGFRSCVLPYHPTTDEQLTDGFWRRRECLNPRCRTQFLTSERVERVLTPKRKGHGHRPSLPVSATEDQLHLQY